MEKWTKGPWDTDEHIKTGAKTGVFSGLNMIADFTGEPDYVDGIKMNSIATVEREFNAQLCAAAPDLYAALKNCVRIMDKGESSADDLENAYQEAVAALDKANGVE